MAKVVVHEPTHTVVHEVERPIVKVVPSNVGIQGPPGPSGAASFQTVHTWAVSGEIKIASGEDDFIPPMFVALGPGQSATVAEVRHQIHSGTSTQVKLQKNGVDLSGYVGINVSTTPGVTDPTDQPVVDGDVLALVVQSATGTPMNLSFTVVLEHQA